MKTDKLLKEIKEDFLQNMGQHFPESCLRSVKRVLEKNKIWWIGENEMQKQNNSKISITQLTDKCIITKEVEQMNGLIFMRAKRRNVKS